MKSATGEDDEGFDGSDGKDSAAQALGRKGGKVWAESLSVQKRSEITKKAAAKRWAKD